MKKDEIAAYLMDRVTGGMIGVNHVGVVVTELYKRGKNAEEIANYCKKNLDLKLDALELEKGIIRFIKQLEVCNLTPSRMRIIRKKKNYQLLSVQVDLSWKCNLRCRHCYLEDTELIDGPLTENEWKNIVNQLAELDVPKITFLGGEPLLNEQLYSLADYACKKGFKIFTTTNGTLVTKDIAKKLKKSGFNEIDVSIDGSSSQSHEFLRGQNTFNATLSGIDRLKSAGLKVKTATVLNKKNFHEVSNLLSLGSEMKIEHMYFNPLLPKGGDDQFWLENNISYEEWLVTKRVIVKWNEHHQSPKAFAECSFDFLYSEKTQNSSYAGCKAGKRELIITPDGYVAACPLLSAKRSFHTMSVRSFQLNEVWKSDAWIVLLRNIGGETKKGKCQKCSILSLCQGGCHVLSLLELGNLNLPDPRCPKVW